MRTSIGRAAAVATLGATLFGVSPAWAQPRDRVAAEALFQAARALMNQGQYAAACEKFEASQRSDPATGTVLNLANCYEKVGRLATAWEHFEAAAQQLPPGDDRLPIARQRAAALRGRLPRIEITLDDQVPAGTQVHRDGVLVDPGALGSAIPVDPGPHRLLVEAPGRADASVSIEVREGEIVRRRLAAGAPLQGTADPWWTGRRVAGVALGGAGVAGIALSLGEGAVAMGKKSIVSRSCNTTTRTCTNQAAIDAAAAGRTASTVSTAAFVAGAALLAGGVILVAIGAPDKPTATRVGAAALPGGGGVTLVGTF